MQVAAPAGRYCFGRFTLLAAEQLLLRDGCAVSLGPRAFELLVVLVANAGRLVTKDTLLAAVWRDLVVEEANLHVQVSHLRKLIGADTIATVPAHGVIGAAAIATVPGQGYRFTLPLQAEAQPARRLSILVLPFVESGAAPGSEHFADAVTDALTTRLARMPGAHVVPSDTAIAYQREPFDLRALARELGVRYALQGRVERSVAGVESNVRLVDAHTGAVIWADTFVVGPLEPAAARREIVARTLNGLTLALVTAEARHANAEAEPGAAGLLMQAGAIALTARSADDFVAALRLIDRARALQPADPGLLAYRARVVATLVAVWPGPDIEVRIAEAERDICAALVHDASNAHAHCTLSRVRQLQLRIGAALNAVDQALEIDPGFAEGVAWRGALLVYNGQVEQAFEPLQRALALAPRDPHRWGPLFWLGKAHVLSGRYEEAIPWLEKSAAIVPFWGTHAFLVAANAQLGRHAEAQAALALLRTQVDIRERNRGLRLSADPVYRRLRREHYAAGLLKAGAIADLDGF